MMLESVIHLVRLVNSPHIHGLLPAYYLLKSIAFDFILFHLTLFD